MIIKKNDDRDLLSTDVIGSSVARSKRWLWQSYVFVTREKRVSGLRKWGSKISFQFNKKSINGATAVKLSTGYCFR